MNKVQKLMFLTDLSKKSIRIMCELQKTINDETLEEYNINLTNKLKLIEEIEDDLKLELSK